MTTAHIHHRLLCRICCKPAGVHPWNGCQRFTWRVRAVPPTPEYLTARANLRRTA